jgi:hypothetical protein
MAGFGFGVQGDAGLNCQLSPDPDPSEKMELDMIAELVCRSV